MINIFLPNIAEAAVLIPASVLTFVGKIYSNILNPLIALMFAIAVAYFIFGIVTYIWNPDNAELREKGRIGMIWGIVGMAIMVSVFAIMHFLINSIDPSIDVMKYV